MANDPNDTSRPRRSGWLTSPGVRWAVPVGAVALIAGGVTLTSVNADAAAKLPAKTAAQLLADVAKAPQHPMSGTIVETARLGLPELPGQAAGTSLQSLITGSHTARVWYGTNAKARISLVGDLAETDVVRNGSDVWLWSSSANEATHYRVPAREPATARVPATLQDPASAARQALAAIDPTTKVQVDGTARVAGRPVYELQLAPRDTRSLIGSVRIAIDGATSVPLRVQIFAKGANQAAFETGFTSVQFHQPAASIFRFTAPKGARVVEGGSPLATDHAARKAPAPFAGSSSKAPSKAASKAPSKAGSDATGEPQIIGKGWTAVAVMKGVDLGALSQDRTGQAVLQGTRTVTGSFGTGRLLSTALVNVLVVGNTAYVGAVGPTVLEQAASSAA
jgi:outer membrane lipoprotein-sorting protein